jgi:hypothetical protein
MKFVIENPNENIVNLVRNLGYVLKPGATEEFNCVRPIGNMGYPRFHVFIREDKDKLIFNLHLDQKKLSYSGNRAHSGEHEGRVVEEEAERMKKIVEGLN